MFGSSTGLKNVEIVIMLTFLFCMITDSVKGGHFHWVKIWMLGMAD